MALLYEKDQEALKKWMDYKVSSMQISFDKSIFMNYVLSLVKRNTSESQMVTLLKEFIPHHAQVFSAELYQRLQNRDFSFTLEVKVEPPKPEPVKIVPAEAPKRAEPVKIEPVKAPPAESAKKVEPVKVEPTKAPPAEAPKKSDIHDAIIPKAQIKKETQYPPKAERTDKKSTDQRKDTRKDAKNKGKYEKPKKSKRQDSSDSYSSSDSSDDEQPSTQKTLDIAMEEPEMQPSIPKDRFIVYIAGFKPGEITIGKLFKTFLRCGKICAIEEDRANGIFYLEFIELIGAYRCVRKGKRLLGNDYLGIDYAFDPKQEELDAIEAELKEKTRKAQTHNQIAPTNNAVDLKNDIESKISHLKAAMMEMGDDKKEEMAKCETQLVFLQSMLKEIQSNT